ncbi:L,D-transpeptidase family protein [Methylocapsa polymorpha]|uniref:L,D-transpeptidase family protein n=1 Tax=Methylocapsa polymorpha TaxID=3080828 RepID=A0ABZ0HNP3_9HYPH|nr:L,D-transpeptidase family protein [Methylocapsa sp. RX1]
MADLIGAGGIGHDLLLLSNEARGGAAVRQGAIAGLAALLATGVADPASAMRHRGGEQAEAAAPRPAGEPLMAIVSLSNQRITIYDADGWILRAPVSSGQSGYETPAGVYSVLQKEAEHYSNLYDDASMPFMQRITWSGIALHAGLLPGYPASHGCVRMPYDFAERLFDMTKVGMRVIVARGDARPVEIDHPVLFKPKPVRADIALKAPTEHWDAREETLTPTPGAAAPEADAPPPADPAPSLTLKSFAAAKSAEAHAAAKKADAARLAAARMTAEAARLCLRRRARNIEQAQLAAAEGALRVASSPPAMDWAGRRRRGRSQGSPRRRRNSIQRGRKRR